jgi:hypothetical protein
MMVAVAAVAVLMGAAAEVRRERRLAQGYLRQARDWELEERWARQGALSLGLAAARAESLSRSLRPRDDELARLWESEGERDAVEAESQRTLAAYYGRLRQKYRRAASFPWAPGAPDPPRPRVRFFYPCRFTALLPTEPLPPEQRWYSKDATDEVWENAFNAGRLRVDRSR